MSYIETSFVGVENLIIDPPITRPNPNNDGKPFTTQYMVVRMEDGSTFRLTFHLKKGSHSLAQGPQVTNELPTAEGAA